MEAVEYQRLTRDLVAWAVSESAVMGLIAVGSTAAMPHDPDEWSDHDVFVVTIAGASAGLLEDPSWLPDSERIVMWHNETADGRAAVYDGGHLIELAVFEDLSLPPLSVNDYRVLVDKADLTARFANLERETTVRVADTGGEGDCRAAQAVGIALQVAGDEVVGVFGQLVLGQACCQSVDRCRGDGEQQQPADGFEDAVQALEDDPDLEGLVEPVSCLELAHDGWSVLWLRPVLVATPAGRGVLGFCGPVASMTGERSPTGEFTAPRYAPTRPDLGESSREPTCPQSGRSLWQCA